jgi:membrane protease YdiL (CAAX protease family)
MKHEEKETSIMSGKLPYTQEGENPDTILKILAWGTILLICIPLTIYRQFDPLASGEPVMPYWLAVADVVMLVLLWLVTWIWSAVKPLRGFYLAALTYCVAIFIIQPLLMYSATWSNWAYQLPWGVWMVVDRLATHFFPVFLMTLTLIGSGIGRKELFLVRGDPGTQVVPSRLVFVKDNEIASWPVLIRNVLVVLVISAVVVLGLQLRPNLKQIRLVLIYLPAILIGAVINAFGEEYEFRSIYLARLLPALGKQQSIFITSAFFGLLHFFGNPGSIPGVLMAAYLGYISAKSMVETRGFVWAFLIHFIGDVIIYAFWAM